ncbi:MAG: hypothetical protein K6E70_02600 [Butyrivibrio sp.]|nr:hypothetical protein [Butyrivibrio sp.]
MKITAFNPVITTNRPEAVLGVFEKFGFTKKHSPTFTGPDGYDVTDYVMETDTGFKMDVHAVDAPIEEEILLIRMNVDDFEEAYKMLTDLGFKPAHSSGKVTETDYAKGVAMVSPIGFNVYLIQHKKKEN